MNMYENTDKFFFLIQKDSRTRGCGNIGKGFSVDGISGSTRSHRGQQMNGTNYLQIVRMLETCLKKG